MGTTIKNGIAITRLNPNNGGGVSDYSALTNKPQINGVELDGDLSGEDLGLTHPYLSLERLCPYLYRVTFDSLPEDNGGGNLVVGGCSAFVLNGKLNRNYDFNYDNAASVIVRTKDFEGMSMITGLNDGEMNDALVAQLPYRMVDGRNNNGIELSVHLLFNDWEYTGAGTKSIPLTRLPFEVLSRVKSMTTIASDLAGVLGNLAVTEVMGGYLLQLLITDGTTTYALIPPTTDGESYELVNATSNPKMSNFRWVNRATVSRSDADLQDRPTGIERYNAMPCSLKDLRFTLAYESPARLSEFIGINGTDKDSSDEELTAIYNLARAEYLTRERDGKTWHTMHSVVYGGKMESLYTQENWDDNCVGGGGISIPTIVIALSQVISSDPLKVQFTAEQDAILVGDDKFVSIDATAAGAGVTTFFKEKSNVEGDYMLVSPTADYDSTTLLPEIPTTQAIAYRHSTMIGVHQVLTAGGLPDQEGMAGKVLKTNGTDAYWGTDTPAEHRMYSIDFGQHEDSVSMINMYPAYTIARIRCVNVAQLKLTRVGTAVQEVITPGDGLDIAVEANQQLIWDIVRTTDGSTAVVGVNFNFE